MNDKQNITIVANRYPSFIMRLGTFALRHLKSKKKDISEHALLTDIASRRARKPCLVPNKLKQKYQIVELNSNGMRVYHFQRRGSEPSEHVYYIHGGSYIESIIPAHWRIINQIIKNFDVSVTVPVYPLAPEAKVDEVQSKVFAEYKTLAEKVGAEHVSVIGDSAGGGLAVSLAQWLKAKNKPQPRQLILFSPFLDATLTNFAIQDIEGKDPMLDVKMVRARTKLYAGKVELSDPRISPINGDVVGLAKMTIFIGTHDILEPDAERFTKLATEKGGDVTLYIYPKAFHIFIGLWCPETKDVYSKIRI